MKKTLFTLLTAVVAIPAMADVESNDPTPYITTISRGENGVGNYFGGTINLSYSDYDTNNIAFKVETVELQSITFYATPSGTSDTLDFKLAVYKYSQDSTTGTFVALSENAVTWSTGSELTFNFTGQKISISDRYQLLFVSNEAEAADVDTFDEYKTQAKKVRITVGNQTGGNLPQGWGTYKSESINSWEGQYLPKIQVVTTPEPATATLSLLALAGLAARRRRH